MLPLTTQSESTIYRLAADLMAAAASDADRARIDRALDLVETVERLPSGQWSVPSSTGLGGYVVSRDARTCCCPDYVRRETACKHVWSVRIAQQVERAEVDAEQVEADDDTYYCVLCEEPIPAAEVVETRWGFMHERCAATEPRETDEDARYALTGKGYLTLIHSAALPAPIGTITVQPMPAHLVALASELYDDYPTDAA